ncbi:hypothetical protein INS49_014030 [Diaporthe citri]|uniref:uncharacterized protein n=1 Tax=Diaporthe citri TaxID=83186 RepID=UPI001C814412|nr:uncharacterized protein INS49_014030 [Diaporthe citri]KAG6358146.1 hypothetical protein INS49_014030 [Diaporthe citri]
MSHVGAWDGMIILSQSQWLVVKLGAGLNNVWNVLYDDFITYLAVNLATTISYFSRVSFTKLSILAIYL